MISLKDKRAAIELSMTTVVVIVLSMTMLILGLTLIRTIFLGATANVDQVNEKVKQQINSLFLENKDEKIQIYLPNKKATISQGRSFGVDFAIRNVEGQAKTLSYSVTPAPGGTCPQGTQNWIIVGGTGSVNVPSGDVVERRVTIQVPATTPLCTTEYDITVSGYAQDFFDVEVQPKGVFG